MFIPVPDHLGWNCLDVCLGGKGGVGDDKMSDTSKPLA